MKKLAHLKWVQFIEKNSWMEGGFEGLYDVEAIKRSWTSCVI